MRKKQDIVYEKDLGLDFGFPEFDEPEEEESAPPDDLPVANDGEEIDEATASLTSDEALPPPPDWSRYGAGDSPVVIDDAAEGLPVELNLPDPVSPRLEALENKVVHLEQKMDRIVSLLERISAIYGKNGLS